MANETLPAAERESFSPGSLTASEALRTKGLRSLRLATAGANFIFTGRGPRPAGLKGILKGVFFVLPSAVSHEPKFEMAPT